MSIELHCPECRKLIRAPDDAGGKRGQCPYCKNSVYIPLPPDDSEEIRIAPMDDDEERNAEKLRRESLRHATAMDHVTDAGPDYDVSSAEGAPGEVVDIADEVERFVRAMHESKLDAAEAATTQLKKNASRARDHIEGLLVAEAPPHFEDLPRPLLLGFLKMLLDRLK